MEIGRIYSPVRARINQSFAGLFFPASKNAPSFYRSNIARRGSRTGNVDENREDFPLPRDFYRDEFILESLRGHLRYAFLLFLRFSSLSRKRREQCWLVTRKGSRGNERFELRSLRSTRLISDRRGALVISRTKSRHAF